MQRKTLKVCFKLDSTLIKQYIGKQYTCKQSKKSISQLMSIRVLRESGRCRRIEDKEDNRYLKSRNY